MALTDVIDNYPGFPEGVDGFAPVTVAVPAPEIRLQEKTITENGDYTADSGFDDPGAVQKENRQTKIKC